VRRKFVRAETVGTARCAVPVAERSDRRRKRIVKMHYADIVPSSDSRPAAMPLIFIPPQNFISPQPFFYFTVSSSKSNDTEHD
jgi:hypothetical protein